MMALHGSARIAATRSTALDALDRRGAFLRRGLGFERGLRRCLFLLRFELNLAMSVVRLSLLLLPVDLLNDQTEHVLAGRPRLRF